MSYDKEMKGTLSENAHATNDKHPKYKGKCRIGGVDYYISGWLKKGTFGDFTSLSFQSVDEAQAEKGRRSIEEDNGPLPSFPNDRFQDEIPW